MQRKENGWGLIYKVICRLITANAELFEYLIIKLKKLKTKN